MYIESGLNYISVGTLLDLQDYLKERHEYIICDGVIYEKVDGTDRIIAKVRIRGCGLSASIRFE